MKKNGIIKSVTGIVNIAWYSTIILTMVYFSMGSLHFISNQVDASWFKGWEGDFSVPFDISNQDIKFIDRLDKTNKRPIETIQVAVPFPNGNKSLEIILFLYRLVELAITFVILFHLRKITRSFSNGSPFIHANQKSIQTIGYMVIFESVFSWILQPIIDILFHVDFMFRDILIAKSVGKIELQFGFSSLFLGLIILVIAEVFKQGIELQEEKELTI